MRKYSILILLSLILFGCGDFEAIDVNQENLELAVDAECGYNFDSIITETFDTDSDDPEARAYQMSVSMDQMKNYQMRATHVAELISMMVEMHKHMELPENDAVYDLLNNGHIVVMEDNLTYYQWFAGSPEEALNMGAAMVVEDPASACWHVPEGAKWSILIHAEYYNAASLSALTHRLTHLVALAMTGDRDTNHEQPDLWVNWKAADSSEINSLQARTYHMYEAMYGRCNREFDSETVPPHVEPQERPYTEVVPE